MFLPDVKQKGSGSKRSSSTSSRPPLHEGTRSEWDAQVEKGMRYVDGSSGDCPGSAEAAVFELPDGSQDEMTNGSWDGWWPVGTKIKGRDSGRLLHVVSRSEHYPTPQKVRIPCDPN